ncbi:hypothetical protein GALMADRAFT_73557, partial [Galerina marginata CBS 339.88]
VIAGFLNWCLLGILALQVYLYYLAFPKDRLFAKVLVYTVFVLELGQTGVVAYDIYLALASSYGDPSAVDAIRTYWLSIPVSGGISGGIGQFFFAYRIWMLSSKGTPIIIGTLALASVISALISAEAFFRARTFSTLLSNDNNSGSFASIGVWNGIGAICDIVIALSMPYYLMRHGTGMRRTHVMIVKLVRLIIETGGLTAVVAILHLCLYFANSQSFIVPGLTVSKIYANTLLVMLNNRMRMVNGRLSNDDDENSQISSGMLFRDRPRSHSQSAPRHTSRIIVSNDRLIFRLDDLQRSNGMSGARRPSHATAVESMGDVSAVAVVSS